MHNWSKSKQKQAEFQKDHLHTSIDSDGLPQQLRSHRRRGLDPWDGRIPWRREWQPIPVFLPGESNGKRSLAGYSPRGFKELETTEATQCVPHRQGCRDGYTDSTGWLNQFFQRVFQCLQKQLRPGLNLYCPREGSQTESTTWDCYAPSPYLWTDRESKSTTVLQTQEGSLSLVH